MTYRPHPTASQGASIVNQKIRIPLTDLFIKAISCKFVINKDVMKVLLEIKDSKFDAFMKLLGQLGDVKAEQISETDVDILNEIKEIQLAFEHAEKLKNGKLTAKPIEALLNDV